MNLIVEDKVIKVDNDSISEEIVINDDVEVY